MCVLAWKRGRRYEWTGGCKTLDEGVLSVRSRMTWVVKALLQERLMRLVTEMVLQCAYVESDGSDIDKA